jgi:hypothetical protein
MRGGEGVASDHQDERVWQNEGHFEFFRYIVNVICPM